MPNGEIEARQVKRLKEIGSWLNKHGDAIYGTRGGPFKPDKWGVSTSKGNLIYVHVLKPKGNKLKLPPLDQKVKKASIFHGKELDFTQDAGGVIIGDINYDASKVDNIIVLEVEE